jgi:hypothetical protein
MMGWPAFLITSKQSPVRAFSAGKSILIIQAFLKLTTKSVGALLLLFDRAKRLESNQDVILTTRGRPRVVCLFNFVLFPELLRDYPIFGKAEVSGIIVTLP